MVTETIDAAQTIDNLSKLQREQVLALIRTFAKFLPRAVSEFWLS